MPDSFRKSGVTLMFLEENGIQGIAVSFLELSQHQNAPSEELSFDGTKGSSSQFIGENGILRIEFFGHVIAAIPTFVEIC